ncbi:MAG: hypothetical protein EZS28_004296 [Streblomastix strix]|uniref:Uncharacterized protein n=1 Tax=Streblomastix strix TaxID=222440 RepID=A0A5J4WYI3_9EUKA|nr:MAG: hypothetical protein EZS28_004296 [Streblomastix strix]
MPPKFSLLSKFILSIFLCFNAVGADRPRNSKFLYLTLSVSSIEPLLALERRRLGSVIIQTALFYINRFSPLLRMLDIVCAVDLLLRGERPILDLDLLPTRERTNSQSLLQPLLAILVFEQLEKPHLYKFTPITSFHVSRQRIVFLPFLHLIEIVMFTPLGSQEIFPVCEYPPLFCSKFPQVETDRGLAPGCQRCQSSLQFQFATTEVFVYVTLPLTGDLLSFLLNFGFTNEISFELCRRTENGFIIITIRSTFKIELQFQFRQDVVQLYMFVYVREATVYLLLMGYLELSFKYDWSGTLSGGPRLYIQLNNCPS